MIRRSHAAAALLWALLALLGFTAPAAAQGVTTSAVTGRVTNEQGEPIEGVAVVATNTRTGAEYRVVTRADGRYLLQGLQPGGPYRVQASRVGLAMQSRAGVNLALSATQTVDFTLAAQAVLLEAIAVTAEDEGAVISAGRTGTATVISDSSIARLPTISRDFTDFTRLVPQISTSTGGGTSGGGRNFRFNSIQIDGAANNDLFGLASSGTPGGQANTKPITLEAIQEFQVVLAPFDVRQGGFTGAGINAVTKSGTNDWEGSFAFFGRNENLVGRYEYDRAGNTIRGSEFSEFRQDELAFSLGGPIVRDRAFFFVAGELARREAPSGVFIDEDLRPVGGVTINGARVDSARAILQSKYNYDAGAVGDVDLQRESNNLFARLDFNLGANNRLTLRHNYVDAWDDNFARTDAAFVLGQGGYVFNSTTNSSVAQLNSTLGNQVFNEFRVGYTTVRDHRDIPSTLFPRLEIDLPAGSCATSGTCRILAGSENSSVANALDQDVLEITNDISLSRGIHSITVGTHNEFFDFSNLFVQNLYGLYRFPNLQALSAGTPNQYSFAIFNDTVTGAKPRAEFAVQALSFYAQDRVSLSSRFTLTPGIRFDLTRFPDNPGRNLRFEQVFTAAYKTAQQDSFVRRTDQIPESNWQVNPRIGFNWDVRGDQTTQVRGGIGLFSGRTPYVWVSNAYGNTGLDYTRFQCTGSGASSTTIPPAFVANPANQPKGCVNAAGVLQPPSASPNEINTVSPDFEMPQVLRYSLAVDHQLPYGLIGTLEGLYTKSNSDPVYRDLAIVPVANTTVEGRQAWTRLNTTGFGNVYDVFNTDENFSYSLTAQLQRPFLGGWEGMIAYTYSRSEDVNSLTSSTARSNFRFNPIDQNPNAPHRTRSNNDMPHRIVGSFTRQFKFDVLGSAATDISLIYVGESGRPYSYTYNGDVNGDTQDANDLIFVPATADQARFEPVSSTNPFTPQASWANLNAFIESVECLRQARGTVIERNACRQPWTNRFDVRLAQMLPTLRGQGAQFTIDVLNFANLLNRRWGRNEFIANQADQALRRAGAQDSTGRVLLGGFGPRTSPFTVSDLNSRYQIAAGIRYTF
jgi:hypothetical protein